MNYDREDTFRFVAGFISVVVIVLSLVALGWHSQTEGEKTARSCIAAHGFMSAAGHCVWTEHAALVDQPH